MTKLYIDSNQPYNVMIDKKIANLAYRYWEQRGRPHGSPEVDWYRAVDDVDSTHIGSRAGASFATTMATSERIPSSQQETATFEIAKHNWNRNQKNSEESSQCLIKK